MTQHNKCYVIFIIITAIAKDTAGTRVPHASSLGVCLFSFSDDQYTSASITTPIRAPPFRRHDRSPEYVSPYSTAQVLAMIQNM